MLGELVQTETDDGVRLDGFLSVPPPNAVLGDSAGSDRRHRVWIVTHGVNGNCFGSNLLKTVADKFSCLGYSVLLANSRGHDICSFNSGTVPMRIGSQFEQVQHCVYDFNAWVRMILGRGLQSWGIAAHSLGAVKAAYWISRSQPQISKFVAISPPRLNTQLLLTDPKRASVFQDHLQLSQSLCEAGKPEEVIKVRFPLPNWVSAATFHDKYGSGDKYDYLAYLEEITSRTLWVFGESEVRHGSVNFLDSDLTLKSRIEQSSLFHHTVESIDGADHSYRDKRDDLVDCVAAWDAENG